jgi:UDP-3-O-[3-hydroxymyristoyl] glucosamine N-acyltransferase
MMEWYIVGTGAHARKVYHAVLARGESVIGFVDEDPRARAPIEGMHVCMPSALAAPVPGRAMVVAIGNAEVRRRLMHQLQTAGWPLPPLIHPSAWVAPGARLGPGVFVAAQAAVESGSEIERGAIVDLGVLVDHDARVGEFVHLRPGHVLQAGENARRNP